MGVDVVPVELGLRFNVSHRDIGLLKNFFQCLGEGHLLPDRVDQEYFFLEEVSLGDEIKVPLGKRPVVMHCALTVDDDGVRDL